MSNADGPAVESGEVAAGWAGTGSWLALKGSMIAAVGTRVAAVRARVGVA